MAKSRGDEQKNIPPDKMFEEYLDWFGLGQTCIKMIEIGKPTQNSVKMPRDFKMETGDGLGNMLSSKYLQTPSIEQKYENSDAEMKPEEEPLNIDYELDSGINSDYDSDGEEEIWSDATEYYITKECENNNRELDKSIESNEKEINVNETSLYGVVKEDTSKKGQILNSYKVKTLTKVENGEIYDWLKATDEENFSELNSTLEACEEINSSISSKFSGFESKDPGEEPKVRSRSVSK